MKKHLLTVALGLLMSASAFAQVEFVDASGNVIPDGSTVVRNEIETPVNFPTLGKNQQINAGISVKNSSSSSVSVKSQLDVTDLPFGQLTLCFPGSCWINVGNLTGPYPSHQPTQTNLAADGPWTSPNGSLGAGKTESLQTEWVISRLQSAQWDGTNGSFTATYSLLVNDEKVSTIKVLYTTDPDATGVAGVTVNNGDKKVVATYNAAGQEVSASHKGLTVVKYSDGSTRKVVIK